MFTLFHYFMFRLRCRLRGLMFRSNLETLSSFQYAFAETHSEIPPPHPLVSQIWWSSFLQSWTSRITKQFLLHLLLKFEVSSEALPDSHSISDSSLVSCYVYDSSIGVSPFMMLETDIIFIDSGFNSSG